MQKCVFATNHQIIHLNHPSAATLFQTRNLQAFEYGFCWTHILYIYIFVLISPDQSHGHQSQQYESVCGLTSTHMFGFWCCSAWLWAMKSRLAPACPYASLGNAFCMSSTCVCVCALECACVCLSVCVNNNNNKQITSLDKYNKDRWKCFVFSGKLTIQVQTSNNQM